MSAGIGTSLQDKLTYDRLLKLHNSAGNGSADIYWMNASFIKELNSNKKSINE